jgi:fructosamine-3-kinase
MRITKHAFERMQERGISEVHIMQVLDDKAILVPSKSQEDVSILHGTVNGRNLAVVVNDKSEDIITAYWTKTKRSKQ